MRIESPNFFKSEIAVDLENPELKQILELTNTWYSRILTIVNKKGLSGESELPKKNVADELEKLAVLVDSGILTKAEFETQKKKLLNDQ